MSLFEATQNLNYDWGNLFRMMQKTQKNALQQMNFNMQRNNWTANLESGIGLSGCQGPAQLISLILAMSFHYFIIRSISISISISIHGWHCVSPLFLYCSIEQTVIQIDCLIRSALDPIGRSPFLPWWNSHKVELFSAFISHLDDILSWKCSWKCKSLRFERKKIDMKGSRIWTHDPENPIYHTNH